MSCVYFERYGVCKSMMLHGYCRFKHVQDEPNQRFQETKRCRICTMPMPCCNHFPSLGKPLCSHCVELARTAEDGEEFLRKESVGFISRKNGNGEMENEKLYGVVEEDKQSIKRVLLWSVTINKFNSKAELTCQTVNRNHVYKIRGKLTA